MLPGRPVALLLLIRIRSGLLLILVWITRSLRQNIGGGFHHLHVLMIVETRQIYNANNVKVAAVSKLSAESPTPVTGVAKPSIVKEIEKCLST